MAKKKNLQDILQMLQTVSQMNVAVYDHHLHHVASCLYKDDVCSLLHESPLCLDRCLKSDLDGLSTVEKTERPYIYTCPFGFFEAIFPILHQDALAGYLIIGPAVAEGETSDAELLRRMVDVAPELDVDALRAGIAEVPHHVGERLRAICEMLEVFADYIESHTLLVSRNLTVGQLTKSYVKKNLTQKITLGKLSMALHCNTVTLTETFRREFGQTIMQYVQQKRMERATYLLRTSDASIAEIAEHCGIPQTEYFSKCFKSYFGISPTDWRRGVRSGELPDTPPVPTLPLEDAAEETAYDYGKEDFLCSNIDQP